MKEKKKFANSKIEGYLLSKNSNAFTLIELLAIIIILAIIAVITVPIILNVIDESKRGAAIDSAYGYRKAINQYYLTETAKDFDYDLEDGVYTVNSDGTLSKGDELLDIDVSGNKPTKGWVEIENGEVKYFSLKIGDYIVSLTGESDDIVATKGGEPLLTKEQRKLVEVQKKADNYLKELKQQCSDNIKNKAKDVSYLNDLVSDSEEPIKGWVKFDENCNAIDFSVKYGDYVVSYDETGENGYKSKVTEGEPKTKPIPAPVSFETDDWDTIIENVKAGNTSAYPVGATKKVKLTTTEAWAGEYTLRVANNSNYDCTLPSKTACGFVLEFAEIITTHNMNPSPATNVGGWPASAMYTFVNNDIYNALPVELRNGIIETTSVSGHGSTQGEGNFTTTDKLYLLSRREVWDYTGTYDTAQAQTRQLDYYKNNGVTTSSYSAAIKKKSSGSVSIWWLRSAISNYNTRFSNVNAAGYSDNNDANTSYGVAPAFRIR